MKKLILITSILASIFTAVNTRAQVDFNLYSGPVHKLVKPKMHYYTFLGSADEMVYSLFTTKANKKKDRISNLFLNMHDGDNMTILKKVPLLQGSEKSQDKYENFEYYDHTFSKDGIIFYFTSPSKNKSYDVYLAAYDYDLKLSKPLTKITNVSGRNEIFFGLAHHKYPYLAFVTMNKVKKDETPTIEYQLYDHEFELVKRKKLNLPYDITGMGRKAISDNMTLSISGHLVSTLTVDKKKEAKKKGVKKPKGKEDRYYKKFLVINLEKETVSDLDLKMKDPMINLGDYTWYIHNDDMVLTGFYSDRKKSPKRFELHGMFFMRYDSDKNEFTNERLTPFSPEFIKLTNSQNTMVSNRNRKKEQNKESIDEMFYLNADFFGNDESITIYCEPRLNTETTHCSNSGGVQTCETVYKSRRGSLFYFKIDKEGDMVMFNSIRKFILYSGYSPSVWYKKSTRVLRKNDNTDVVLFESTRKYNLKDRNDLKGEKFKIKQVQKTFAVAEIDLNTGSYEIDFPTRDKKKYKKYQPASLENVLYSRINDKIYFISKKTKTVTPMIWLGGFGFYFNLFTPKQKIQYHVADINNSKE
jgi:hypothetical protein